MKKAVQVILFSLACWWPAPEVQAVVVVETGPVQQASHRAVAESARESPRGQRGLLEPEILPLGFSEGVARGLLLVQNEAGAEVTGEEQAPASREEAGDDQGDDMDEEFEEEFGKSIDSEIIDPFEGYNRVMTSFNDFVFVWIYDPVARAWRWVTPEFARFGIANFFDNLLFPLRFINNLLQAKILHAGEELLRFCINTIIGVLGFWDAAEDLFGLEAHDEDFGQTLGYWGVGAGPHIVLPFLGPSNLRDTLALAPDYYLDPKRFLEPSEEELGVKVFEEVNNTSLHIGEYENLKKDALDLYPFLRDAYEQNRLKKISE